MKSEEDALGNDEVVDAFQALCDSNLIPDEAVSVLNYFEDTWIGRSTRNRRRQPQYAHHLWNCSEAARKDMPKTNNAVEGWHNTFESTLDVVHPNIYKLLEAFKREQSLMEAEYEQSIAGKPPTKKKEKYRDSAKRLQRTMLRYF